MKRTRVRRSKDRKIFRKTAKREKTLNGGGPVRL